MTLAPALVILEAHLVHLGGQVILGLLPIHLAAELERLLGGAEHRRILAH